MITLSGSNLDTIWFYGTIIMTGQYETQPKERNLAS